MDIDQLFDLLKAYQDTSLTLWNIYIAVIFGITGYVMGAKKQLGKPILLLMTIGFLVFATGNFGYLERNQKIIFALSNEISEVSKSDKILSCELKKTLLELPKRETSSIILIHIPVDVIVVLFLWVSPYIRSRFMPENDQEKNPTQTNSSSR
jgi:hypothetical protein